MNPKYTSYYRNPFSLVNFFRRIFDLLKIKFEHLAILWRHEGEALIAEGRY